MKNLLKKILLVFLSFWLLTISHLSLAIPVVHAQST